MLQEAQLFLSAWLWVLFFQTCNFSIRPDSCQLGSAPASCHCDISYHSNPTCNHSVSHGAPVLSRRHKWNTVEPTGKWKVELLWWWNVSVLQKVRRSKYWRPKLCLMMQECSGLHYIVNMNVRNSPKRDHSMPAVVTPVFTLSRFWPGTTQPHRTLRGDPLNAYWHSSGLKRLQGSSILVPFPSHSNSQQPQLWPAITSHSESQW